MGNKKSLGRIIVGLLVAAVVWFLQEKGLLEKEGSSGSEASVPVGEVSTESFTTVKTQGEGWTYLKDCRLITGRNNDGDSFHVKHGGEESEFRLYFRGYPREPIQDLWRRGK